MRLHHDRLQQDSPKSMQSNSSAPGPLGALNVCGGEEDDISGVVSLTGAASNLAALNLSLNCWLLILSKESSLDLHADGANLAVSTDDELCLVRFSDSDSSHWDPQVLLGLYQTQKVLLGFVVPLIVISVCYLLLLKFILRRRIVGSVVNASVPERSESERGRLRRRSKVTRSVTIVVLSFFICWLPNQALTLWGVLIKFDLVPFSKAFYNAQAYAFPLTVCLAHANSCLNPVLYCLIRKEYRAGLKELLLRVSHSVQNVLTQGLRERRVADAPPSLVMMHKDRNM
ncbi:hypothetical protein FQN60_016690 [Etheostoma spectabile]|uniref:G-protein coupled receptors family 1 profile domain-containing protein n=1 Tax=Etheostoma spectabile TaxID=54343 RepID=A0A5J5D1P0_9PERO|nr:hypothetical protein FQN60_016116 [Etheostoma spectabile]KAA8587828.1 hypothetical protein FQN60_016690 [Etheostoma spectabile]